MKPCREALPLVPLLHAYFALGLPSLGKLHALPGLGSRFAAVMSASARILFADFLATASGDDVRDAVERFYSAVTVSRLADIFVANGQPSAPSHRRAFP